jgi:hypothetical protein
MLTFFAQRFIPGYRNDLGGAFLENRLAMI